MGLTVAVTGPTGEIGRSVLAALERHRDVERILGMARRPFDPAARGWSKTEYRQGDVLDRSAVGALVAEADVVLHLAFLILGSHEETEAVNREGSRNVFAAARDAARPRRLVYASSVAAYGFHDDNPVPLTEDVPARGTEGHYYSRQKAAVEAELFDITRGSELEVYVFRPCIVAGPDAPLLYDNIPYVQLSERLPGAVRRLFDVMPVLKPVIPDPGVPFQLVHHDDVAEAIRAGVLGRGEPGIYNLAAPGEITLADLADALGWYSVPVPDLLVDATGEIASRLPFVPAEAQWINVGRVSVVMDTNKAHRLLRWRPKHDARETLAELVATARGREPARRAE